MKLQLKIKIQLQQVALGGGTAMYPHPNPPQEEEEGMSSQTPSTHSREIHVIPGAVPQIGRAGDLVFKQLSL